MIVLDVACGAAHAAEQAAPHVRQVVGLDLTPSLLEVGAERLRGAGHHERAPPGRERRRASVPRRVVRPGRVPGRAASLRCTPEQPSPRWRGCAGPSGRVVVADMVAPSAEVREPFDDLHRCLDPSHAGVLLEAELAELLRLDRRPARVRRDVGPVQDPRRAHPDRRRRSRRGHVSTASRARRRRRNRLRSRRRRRPDRSCRSRAPSCTRRETRPSSRRRPRSRSSWTASARG